MAASKEDNSPDTKISVTDEKEKRINLIQRAQWLRAAILGANDGLLSTTLLMLGVGAAKDEKRFMVVSGLAGAVAGACSMAVGEFVSVSTQRDIQRATCNKCPLDANLQGSPVDEETKTPEPNLVVSSPYPKGSAADNESRITLASPVVHTRSPLMKVIPRDVSLDEVGQEGSVGEVLPSPYKAALASGLAFLCGSLVPLLTAVVFTWHKDRILAIVVAASVALALFGGAGARLGGLPVGVSAMRVLIGGWISMAATYGLLKPLDKDHDLH